MTAHDAVFDLLVVGGGINGCGIARDAAGRGLRVLLCERSDLASGTSSASSKLIHGGLRYLERYEFRFVREALVERDVLRRVAPHLIRPSTFVLPHRPGLRPSWLLRAGLFLYDHLGPRGGMPATRTLRLRHAPEGEPLLASLQHGFAYSDCRVDDARLVVLNAVDAAERGAQVLTRTRCVALRRGAMVEADLVHDGGAVRTVAARAVVNAAGPWLDDVQGQLGAADRSRRVRLVKGSHIVVPRLADRRYSYTLQHDDGRVVFVLPFHDAFSLVGTTDIPYTGDPAQVAASPEEIAYLCDTVGRYFRRAPTPGDVRWSYAGVRSLHDDGSTNPSAVTRDYRLDLDDAGGLAPVLAIYGGKITTYRRLAEDALAALQPALGNTAKPWTHGAPLPGGDVGGKGFDAFCADAARRYPFMPPAELQRLCGAYGTRLDRVLGDARTLDDLGEHFGAGLREAELRHLVEHEWARDADDVLWRRSKLGLFLDAAQRARVERRLQDWRAHHGDP